MIDSEIVEALRPLERFEDIRRRAVRLGDRLADLSYANPYGAVAESARGAIGNALESERELDLQYTPFGGHTLSRRAVADALRQSHALPFRFKDVVLTPGAMAALNLGVRCVGDPGDEVIIPVPCWLDYPVYVRNQGMHPILVPLEESTFAIDVEAIVSAVTERTCAILLGHPSNPVGNNHSRESVRRLASALDAAESRTGRAISLLLDETHRDFIPGEDFHSFSREWARSLIIHSFGKYHGIQGQRIGYLTVSPRHPERQAASEALVRDSRVTGFCTPTALMQRALPELLSLRHDLSWLDGWRARFTADLSAEGYRVVPSDGTFFLYVATPGGISDWQFVEALAEDALLVLPAAVFHHSGYFRISLTGDEAMLHRALDLLVEHSPT